MKYAFQKRGLAMGLSLCGVSVSIIVLPQVHTILVKRFELTQCLLILASTQIISLQVLFSAFIWAVINFDTFEVRLACLFIKKHPLEASDPEEGGVQNLEDFLRKYHLNNKLFLVAIWSKFLTDCGYIMLYHFGPSFFIRRGLDETRAEQIMRYIDFLCSSNQDVFRQHRGCGQFDRKNDHRICDGHGVEFHFS